MLADSHAIVVELTARSRMTWAAPNPSSAPTRACGPASRCWKTARPKPAPPARPGSTPTPASSAPCAPGAPPPSGSDICRRAHTVITGERYLQAIGRCRHWPAARWIVALDDDFAAPPANARRSRRRARLASAWRRSAVLRSPSGVAHAAALRQAGRGAGSSDDALLSGGILDMIAAKHTPVRAIPRPAPDARVAGRRDHGGGCGCRSRSRPSSARC